MSERKLMKTSEVERKMKKARWQVRWWRWEETGDERGGITYRRNTYFDVEKDATLHGQPMMEMKTAGKRVLAMTVNGVQWGYIRKMKNGEKEASKEGKKFAVKVLEVWYKAWQGNMTGEKGNAEGGEEFVLTLVVVTSGRPMRWRTKTQTWPRRCWRRYWNKERLFCPSH